VGLGLVASEDVASQDKLKRSLKGDTVITIFRLLHRPTGCTEHSAGRHIILKPVLLKL
jgi:hypothetical protein